MADKNENKKLDETEFQSLISGLISDASQFVDTELSPDRALATAYYKGEKFGNEEDGRSQFVITEVRDAVLAVLPDVVRVVFGPERYVELAPRTAEQVAQAEQATDAIQYIFAEENAGFLRSLAVLKDGLVRRLGVFKWGYDDASKVKAFKLKNVPQAQLEQWVQDPAVELNRATQISAGAPALVGPDGQPAGEPKEAMFDVELTHTESDGKIWIREVPPEEFLYDREARSLDEATLVGQRMRLTQSDLIGLGVSAADIESHGGDDTTVRDSAEAQARMPSGTGVNPDAGDANDKHLYCELYVKVDYDGDGIAELRKVCTLGVGHYIVMNEPTDERPYALFCPDPEPHTISGQSYADRVMDLQLVKSQLVRANLDSLAAALFPRLAYMENKVSAADILNTEIGGPIRVKDGVLPQQAIQAITTPYTGKESFSILEYFDGVGERRLGRDKGAMGLDADALQSSTSDAVTAALTASQAQAEMLVRIFIEMTMKPMFRGVYRLLVKHQPQERMLRLRGKWVPVNPAVWDADMDVVINMAFGVGRNEQKIAVLAAFAAKQELIMTTLGPQNPLVSLHQYSNSLRDALELSGRKDTSRYMTEVPADWQPPEPAEPAPDPAMEMVKVEAAKNEAAAQAKMQELELKMKELEIRTQMEDLKRLQAEEAGERKLDQELMVRSAEMEKQHELKMAELQMKADNELKIAMLRLEVDRERIAAHTEVAAAKIVAEAEANGAEMDADARQAQSELAADLAKHDDEMSVRETEASMADPEE